MSVSKRLMNRRRVLKGMLGGTAVTVGLPLLECFLNTNGTAMAATGAALPSLFGTWCWGLGCSQGRWAPESVGKIDSFGVEMRALNAVKEKINIFSGLKVFLDGRPSLVHYTGLFSILTGTVPLTSAVTTATIDTLVADEIGTRTRFRSLELTSVGNPRVSHSYRAGGVVQPSEPSPASLYARIFGPEFKDPNAADFKPDPAVMARLSVLSGVTDQSRALYATVGAADRARLDEYFTSVRQIEKQLQIMLQRPEPLAACTIPDAPPGEEKLSTDIVDVKRNHTLMAKLAAHALACGQTNVVNLAYSEMASSVRKSEDAMTHHICTHEEAFDPKEGCQLKASWFAEQAMGCFAEYLTILDGIKEGDKSLLDRMVIFAATDTGYAPAHTVENVPLMIAGSGGGRLKTGLHISAKGDPATRVGLTIQQALGMSAGSWGTGSMQTSKPFTEILVT